MNCFQLISNWKEFRLALASDPNIKIKFIRFQSLEILHDS